MPGQHPTRVRFTFGPIEVDTATGEVRNGGVRIKLSGQPLKMLLVLLARPGQVVTREELRNEIWPDNTFVDFEHGLHAGMNKLRRALNDSTGAPKYIETVPTRGYRFIGKLDDELPAIIPAAAVPVPGPPKPGPGGRIAAFVIGIALVGGAIAWRFWPHPVPAPIWKFSRITSPSSASFETPALSPDGRLVAYSSDDNPEGHQDIYVKQIASGQPVRLTFDGFNNTSPQFSPDGTRIVFRSGRNGGGIYEVPAGGGPARLIARQGHDPRYSPDGLEVAYWKGAPSIGESIPGNGEVWIAPLNGDAPRRVGAQLTTARHPVWSPDGKALLVVGYGAATSLKSSALDWWLVSKNGSTVVKTGAYQLLLQSGLRHDNTPVTPVPRAPEPGCWSAAGNRVTFSRHSGDARNIWQLAISPETGRVESGLERLTTGAALEISPSCAGDSFVFSSSQIKSSIWSFPMESNTGAAGKAMAPEPNEQRNPTFSKDGRFVAYLSTRAGPGNVILHELATGNEQIVAPSALVQGFPVPNSTGDRVAYVVYEQRDRRVVYVSSPGEVPQKLCEGCLRATDWSLADKGLLVFLGNPYQIDYLDVASRQRTTLLRHPSYQLLYGKFSPDNRWISFTARIDSSHGRIFIAPFAGLQPVAENTWIPIADADPDDYAVWSRDGLTMYFTSSRDGFTCLWGQRLDAEHHRPVGNVFEVAHFHGRLRFEHKGFSLSDGRVSIALAEKIGSIWMMSRSNTGNPGVR